MDSEKTSNRCNHIWLCNRSIDGDTHQLQNGRRPSDSSIHNSSDWTDASCDLTREGVEPGTCHDMLDTTIRLKLYLVALLKTTITLQKVDTIFILKWMNSYSIWIVFSKIHDVSASQLEVLVTWCFRSRKLPTNENITWLWLLAEKPKRRESFRNTIHWRESKFIHFNNHITVCLSMCIHYFICLLYTLDGSKLTAWDTRQNSPLLTGYLPQSWYC